jgi:hypothetical protein
VPGPSFAAGFVVSGADAGTLCCRQPGRALDKGSGGVVFGANANDARLPLVGDAVAFWNRSFAELGSAFRLGSVSQAVGAIQVDELRTLSGRVLSGTGPTQFPPESIGGVPGDLIVALSDGNFISFAMRWPSLG